MLTIKGATMQKSQPKKLQLVYDGQCPICKLYCHNIPLDLQLIDARKDSPIMREITAKGLNIDQGMVLKESSTLYYGSDAMAQLARYTGTSGWVAKMNRLLFRSTRRARFFYPLFKACRNVLLKILAIRPIDNLKSDNT